MPNCVIHPSVAAVLTVNNRGYCAACQTAIQAARTRVDRHVQPPSCFVWYEGGTQGWQPIPGTGCAHWVAHQLGMRSTALANVCLEGFPIRVPTVIQGKTEVPRQNVQANDIWVSASLDHTGLVARVTPAQGGQPNTIVIRHDSSRQGGVFENDFATYFHGHGRFYR